MENVLLKTGIFQPAIFVYQRVAGKIVFILDMLVPPEGIFLWLVSDEVFVATS